ncbi:MAG: leucine-rich repeat protein [Clostridia bacterium]|nr:leucine-rich repeat protein [Clostridia bacterium]
MKKLTALFLALALCLGLCSFTASGVNSAGDLTPAASIIPVVEPKVYNGTCGDVLNWSLDAETGVLNITGTGMMLDYSASDFFPELNAPWYSYKSYIKTVNVDDGVTTIGSGAFYNCSSLTSVTIPDSVTDIGFEAFYNCSSLTSVTIGDSVTSIGEYAFRGCSSLTSITIGDSVASIGEDAFYDCSSLTSVHISDIAAWCGIYYGSYYSTPLCMGANLYLNGDLITALVIPDGVTTIGNYAFYKCDSLTSITIPDSVTDIGIEAFYNCSSLTSVTIGDSVASFGGGTFYDCSSLTSITIPDSVTYIAQGAFYGCTALRTVYYTGNAEEWADISIGADNTSLKSANIIFNYCVEDESSEESVADVSSDDERLEDSSSELWETSDEPVEETFEEQSEDDSFVATVDVLYGDVNGDGNINSLDAAQVLKHDAQLIILDGDGIVAADVNADGEVNSLDAAQILKYDAQLIESFPAGDCFAGSDETSQPSNNSENENVEVLPSIEAEIGEYITFGSYEQDNNTANGKEAIEWLVLDKKDGSMLVISKYGLDGGAYFSVYDDGNWKNSNVRARLNNSFIQDAFSETEQYRLITVTTNPDANPEYDSDQGSSTQDRVFLLSSVEANRYFDSDASRACLPTAYALSKGVYECYSGDYKGYCFWWLRTVGSDEWDAACVDADGTIDNHGDSQRSYQYAIRPAMWISTGEIEIEIVPEDSSESEGYSGGAEIGEYITFGSYEQDNNTANGKEAIEWLVLDKKDGRMLVTSKYLLDVQPFHSSYSETTWEHSALRQWMNNDFYNIAFNSAEKAKIPTVTAIADVNEFVFTVTSGNDTQDKLFCLNKTEFIQYFPDRNSSACSPTPYAEALGTRSFWWLRTSGGTRRMAVYVETDGDINPGGTIVSNDCYIRPAMWIEID